MKVKMRYLFFFIIFVFPAKNIRCDVSEFDILKVFNIIVADDSFVGRPPGVNTSYNQPVIVFVNSLLQQLEKVDDWNEDLQIRMTAQISWNDPRFAKIFSESVWPSKSAIKYVIIRNFSKIWIPNIFFPNAKENVDYYTAASPFSFIRLYRNGTISLNKRLSLTFDCPMDFRQFPFDSQICSIQLASLYIFIFWTYIDVSSPTIPNLHQSERATVEKTLLHMHHMNILLSRQKYYRQGGTGLVNSFRAIDGDPLKNVQLFWNDNNAIQISTNFHTMNFELENFVTMTKVSKTKTGEFSSISVDLILSRRIHFYLMRHYLPVTLIVVISWLPFWLGRVLIIRIYIALCSILFLSWHYLAQPNEVFVSYLTYLEPWRGINFIFVFLAASESILISYMIKTNKNKIVRDHPDDSEKFKMLQCKNCPEKKKYLEEIDEKTDLDLEIMKIKANFKVRFINVHKEVKIIDAVSKLLFPTAYSIFVFFYWLRCI